MGLDIGAYSKLRLIENCVFDADGEPLDPETHQPLEQYYQANINPHFPERAAGLEDRAVYFYGEHLHVHAGSYGGYSQWRETLARIAGYQAVETEHFGRKEMRHDGGADAAGSGPFYEQILFSDCEGVIATAVCQKLTRDYAEFAEKAEAEGGRFWEKYQEWRKAFELAADGGCIAFG